jgi:hypothetical protein
VVPTLPKNLVGVVTDEAGCPIADSDVLVDSLPVGRSTTTDEDGRFRIQALYSTQIDLEVRKTGFVTQHLSGAGSPQFGAMQIVLTRGVNLKVRTIPEELVVDDVAVRRRSADEADTVYGEYVGSGTWSLAGVAPGMVTIEVGIGGNVLRWDAHTDDVEIVCDLRRLVRGAGASTTARRTGACVQ